MSQLRTVLLCSVLIVPCLPAPAAIGSLYPHPLQIAGSNPVDLIATDLDHDGRLDVIVTLSGDDELGVLFGRGDGTLGEAVRYPLGDSPGWMAQGDFDEDGWLDVAVANLGSDLSILIGQSDGTFAPETRYGETTGGIGLFVAVGDFNEDNHQDVVMAQDGGNVLFPGNGDGTFLEELPIPGASPAVAVAELDGDGLEDLVIPGAVFLGNGDFTFTAGQVLPIGMYPTHVAAVDLDGDLIVDVVQAERDPATISVLLGNGDGTFAAADLYSVAAGGDPSRVLAEDRDGDGVMDLVVSHGPFGAGISILFGTGGGSFAPPQWYETGSASAYSIAAGDFDGDGRSDLVRGTYGSADVGVVLGGPAGSLVTPLVIPVGTNPESVVAADLDGDGREDLVTANSSSDDVSVVLATGANSFAPEVRFPVEEEPRGLAVAELTGDGIPDLAVTCYATDHLLVLAGDGAGGFAPLAPVSVGTGPVGVAGGLIDDDSHVDLVVSNETSNRVSVLLGNGDGTFASLPPVPVGTGPRGIALGNLDGDAWPDFAVAISDGVVAVRLGNGDGSFDAVPSVTAGIHPTSVALGDLDGDSLLDLAVRNLDGTVHALLGNGDGSFVSSAELSAQGSVTGLAIRDVDGDGHPDLLTGSTVIYGGNGDGTFLPPQYFAAGGVVSADFDLDGRIDLAGRLSLGKVNVTLNQSGPRMLRFLADHVTLEWPSVTGALSYGVYRGALADLVDGDEDGLPDAGYGACVSTLDDDPRDTSFVDATQPGSSQGFFYLQSVFDANGESGLGETSGGLVRQQASPCP